jgi:hypothetical protein
MTKKFSFDPGQECWLLFRAAADPPAQVWMVCKKTERKIQVAPTEPGGPLTKFAQVVAKCSRLTTGDIADCQSALQVKRRLSIGCVADWQSA